MPDWDQDSEQLSKNLYQILSELVDTAKQPVLPTLEIARLWQTQMMSSLQVPDPQYVGRFRGEKGLEFIQVIVGEHYGVPANEVNASLSEFIEKLQQAVMFLDEIMGTDLHKPDDVSNIIDLCAWVHAQWVRIHPFANGNGRTARLWANYIALRYNLPPFIVLRPRPEDGYALACNLAMSGEWKPTSKVFSRLYITLLEST